MRRPNARLDWKVRMSLRAFSSEYTCAGLSFAAAVIFRNLKVFPTCIIRSFTSCLRASETPILRIVYFLFACQRYWCLCQKPTNHRSDDVDVRSWSFWKISNQNVIEHKSSHESPIRGNPPRPNEEKIDTNATICFSIRISKIKRHRLKLSKTLLNPIDYIIQIQLHKR